MAITQVSNSLVKQDLTISGGTVDNTVIGSGTPAAGTFTTVAGTLASTVTGTTQAASDNSTKIATTAYVTTALANLVDSAPGTLNTLNELAAALGDDANFSTTVTNSIATKLPLAGGTLTGALVGTKASFGTASTTDFALRLTDNGVADYDVIFPDTSTYQLTTNTSSDKTFKLLNSGSGTFNLNVEGNVGIGTDLPASSAGFEPKLAIHGSGSPGIILKDTDTAQENVVGTNGAGLFIDSAGHATATNNQIIFRTASSNSSFTMGTAMTIDSSQNVGIGTDSPTFNTGSGLEIQRAGPATLRIEDTGSGGKPFEIYVDDAEGYVLNGRGSGMPMIFKVVNQERLRIDTSGNVVIGDSSASQRLDIVTSTVNKGALLYNSNTTSGASVPLFFGSEADSTTTNVSIENAGAGNLLFRTGATTKDGFGAERMRIDTGGNVLVGTTDTSLYNNTSGGGIGLMASNRLDVARAGDVLATFNRMSNDGQVLQFYQAGGLVGMIGTFSSGIYIATTDGTDSGLGFRSTQVVPCTTTGANRDNAIDLGASGSRFDDIFATNGTIQTSDRNEKQDIEALSDAEQRVAVAAKGLLRKYRWKSAVEEKGDDARIHFGIIAQDLQDAFTAEGLDAGSYAMFISSTWTDEETGEERTRLGVRYSELLAFIISAI